MTHSYVDNKNRKQKNMLSKITDIKKNYYIAIPFNALIIVIANQHILAPSFVPRETVYFVKTVFEAQRTKVKGVIATSQVFLTIQNRNCRHKKD